MIPYLIRQYSAIRILTTIDDAPFCVPKRLHYMYITTYFSSYFLLYTFFVLFIVS
jgi:hypothetical protein